jgi:hypothetical protein
MAFLADPVVDVDLAEAKLSGIADPQSENDLHPVPSIARAERRDLGPEERPDVSSEERWGEPRVRADVADSPLPACDFDVHDFHARGQRRFDPDRLQHGGAVG